ncbi:glycosyltransferase [Parahaliea maris]|uniref:Glycosyltransferase n=1 Tax=Parahaliea maris TaxID=2716870 RepID=A0A5C8ZQW1_9GAMM|nr:glycosyltransferase [Parahaliea maris]
MPYRPKVSIITASYNSQDTVSDTIESVNTQDYENIEHVFVDGQSSDSTLEKIRALSRRSRIVSSEPDQGIYDALNKGIQLASGEIVGFLHGDDLFAADTTVSSIVEAFSDPSVSAAYGDLQYVSRQDTTRVVRNWRSGEFTLKRMRCGWMPPHPTLYLRRSFYINKGLFDCRYKISADYYSILTLFSDPKLYSVYIPEVLVKMRVGGASNASLTNIVRKSREDYAALRRSGIGGIGTLFLKNVRKLPQFIHTST